MTAEDRLRNNAGATSGRRRSAVGAPSERRRAAVISAVGKVLLGHHKRERGAGPSSTPPPNSKRLCLSKSKKSSHGRWEFLDECAEVALSKKYVLKTRMLLRSRRAQTSRSGRTRLTAILKKQIPETILKSTYPKVLSKRFSLYVAETVSKMFVFGELLQIDLLRLYIYIFRLR